MHSVTQVNSNRGATPTYHMDISKAVQHHAFEQLAPDPPRTHHQCPSRSWRLAALRRCGHNQIQSLDKRRGRGCRNLSSVAQSDRFSPRGPRASVLFPRAIGVRALGPRALDPLTQYQFFSLGIRSQPIPLINSYCFDTCSPVPKRGQTDWHVTRYVVQLPLIVQVRK